jgi:hypothetical protein
MATKTKFVARIFAALFAHHILQIVFLRPQEKMIRIYAQWIVAAVTYANIIGNRSIEFYVGKSRRCVRPSGLSDFPVTVMVKATHEDKASRFGQWHCVVKQPIIFT